MEINKKNILFSLDVGISKSGFPIHVYFNEGIQKEMLSQGMSVDTVLSDVFMGFIFEWCRDKAIDVQELYQQHLDRDAAVKLGKSDESFEET